MSLPAPSWEQLKRRKIVQWGLAYLAGAWVVLQLVDILGQQFGWPAGLLRGVTILLAAGFFVTLVVAWYHGEKGRQRVSGPELLMVTALLVIAGAAIAVVSGGADAEARNGSDRAATPPSSNRDSIPHTSIAVLPLDDNSPDPADAYFADAMTEEITSALAKVPGFRVSARSSATKFAERNVTVGKFAREELGVETAEDSASANLARVFEIIFFQDDITDAGAILRRIVRERPSNLSATSLLANIHLINGDLAESLEWYRRAIALDPLDPRHRRAVGLIYMTLGLDPLAARAHEKARELGADVWSRTFQMGLLQGDHEDAMRAADSLRAAGHPYADVYAAGAHLWSGDPETAQHILADVNDALLATFQWEEAPMVAHVSLLAGDTARAERLLRQAEDVPAAPRDLVRGAGLELKVVAVRGDAERATKLLRRATELGGRSARWLRASPLYSRVRDDPDFQAALAEQEALIDRERREVQRMLADEESGVGTRE